MANFGLGLAQGFQLGTQIGDALRQKRMREAFEEAQADKQFKKYTPAQGEQMRREAAMVDEFGNPVYEFSIEPGSTTYTRREVRYPRTSEPAPVSLANIEEPEPRSLGTMYRVPVGEAAYTPDTTGETIYEPNRELAPRPRGLSVSNLPEYSPALLPPEQSRVQQRLGREYGDSMMYSPEATQYLGQTYGAEGLTPTQQRAALMNRYADIISKYESPVEGERFRSMARAEERAEQTFGLTKEMTEIARDKARREERIAGEVELVDKGIADFKAANPNATLEQLTDHVQNKLVTPDGKSFKPSRQALNTVIAQQINMDKTLLDGMTVEIENIIRKHGGSLDSLAEQYNNNPLLDPTTNLAIRKTKDGVVLDFVSAKDPKQILSSKTFSDETKARDFLVNNARNPVTAATMLQQSELTDENIKYLRSRSRYLDQGGPRRGVGRDYTRAENIQEIRGLMQFRESLSKDVDRKRDQLKDMRKDDPMYKALQQDIINIESDIFDLDRDIRDARRSGGGLRRDGGGAAPKRYSIGDVEEATTTDGKKVKVKLVRGDGSREEDWEMLAPSPAKAEAKAEAAPAKEEPPKKDTTKYIREKSPRSGTFIYTESPRGLTKEQWAQLDEDKKKK